jgi:hypothetical protein
VGVGGWGENVAAAAAAANQPYQGQAGARLAVQQQQGHIGGVDHQGVLTCEPGTVVLLLVQEGLGGLDGLLAATRCLRVRWGGSNTNDMETKQCQVVNNTQKPSPSKGPPPRPPAPLLSPSSAGASQTKPAPLATPANPPTIDPSMCSCARGSHLHLVPAQEQVAVGLVSFSSPASCPSPPGACA